MSKREVGRVKWFNSQRGFGFIVDENDVINDFERIFQEKSECSFWRE